MIFFPFFAASIVTLTAYLQTDAAWWKGPTTAFALFGAGFLVLMALPEEIVANTVLPPVIGIASGAWIASGLIGVGAVLALALRKLLSPGRIAGAVFLCSFPLFNILPFLL